MTRVEIENQLMNEIHYLPLDVMEAMLNLALSIKNMQTIDKTNLSIDAAWEKEISERIIAVDNGTATSMDYDEVMADIERRFAA